MKPLLSVIFVLAMLAPLGAHILGIDYALSENRVRISRPTFEMKRILDESYYAQLDAYFNDCFALRGALILAKNWLDYYLFNTSPSKRVHIGRENWLYYRPALNSHTRNPNTRKRDIEDLVLRLHVLDALCTSGGKRFVFTVAPNKSTIYPEHVGFHFKDGEPDTGPYEVLLENLTRQPISNFVRLDALLNEAKNGGQIYDRTDTHWNFAGSLLASTAILEAIYGKDATSLLPTYTFGREVQVGDLTGKIMGLPVKENVLTLSELDYGFVVTGRPLEEGSPLGGIRFAAPDSPRDEKCLLYRDSFAWALIPFIKGAFSRLDMLRWPGGIPSTAGIESYDDIDIIMLEIIERNLRDVQIDLQAVIALFQDRVPGLRRGPLSGTDGTRLVQGSSADAIRILVARTADSSNAAFHLRLSSAGTKGNRARELFSGIVIGSAYLPVPFTDEVSVEIDEKGAISPIILEVIEIRKGAI